MWVGKRRMLLRQLLLATSRGFSPSMRLARFRPTVPSRLPVPCARRRLEGDALTFIEGREPRWCESRDVDECVLSTTIPSDEAKALVDIEPLHRSGFLADVSEDSPPDVGDRTLDLRDVTGAAVLVSTLSTSVTCGPLCPGPTRTSSVSPGCTELMLL
jgi:hypothetical protein